MYNTCHAIVIDAIEKFHNDSNSMFLIINNYSERAICSRLSDFIKEELIKRGLCEYESVVEYNRGMDGNESSVKKLDDVNITLDLAVTKLRYNEGFDNLFCIEMKKEGADKKYIRSDIERLRKLTDSQGRFCYKAGFLIIIYTGVDKPELRIEKEFCLW